VETVDESATGSVNLFRGSGVKDAGAALSACTLSAYTFHMWRVRRLWSQEARAAWAAIAIFLIVGNVILAVSPSGSIGAVAGVLGGIVAGWAFLSVRRRRERGRLANPP
jgi:membrane associated rhomboid family serine protease